MVELWKEHGDYLPFYRLLEDNYLGPQPGGRNLVNILSPAKKLKGGTAPLANVFDNIMKNTIVTIDRDMCNQAAQHVADLGQGAELQLYSISFLTCVCMK